MGKFDGYLFLTDIDGTLTDHRGQISDADAAAIRYFQSEGGLFTVSSGRFPWYIENYKDRFVPNTYIVGINGTMLYDPETKTPVLVKPLADGILYELRECMALCPEITRLQLTNAYDDIFVPREQLDKMEEILRGFPRPFHKIIFNMHAADGERVKRRLVRLFSYKYNFDFSWSEGLELHPVGSGKGELLPDMVRLLGEKGHKIHTTVAAGDYENDLSMLRCADIGYAVGNAVPAVKAAADRVTVSHNENAMAHIIADLERDADARRGVRA